jgi:hypothetical protein
MKHPTKIARKFQHYKTAALVVASLIISTQLWVHYRQDAQNTHYLKTMGSCNQPTTIKIYDETGGVDPGASLSFDGVNRRYSSKLVNIMENKPFKNYVTTVSKYVFAKVEAMGQCKETSGQPQVDLVFVYRPTISREITPFNFQPSKSPETQQLDSPWAKLTLERSPKPNLQAVFIWNERQFYLDRLVNCGWRSFDSKPLFPIDFKTFDRWQQDEGHWKKSDYVKQLPADILLLFTTNRVFNFLPGESFGREQMEKLTGIARGEKIGYTDLNKSLIDRLFASDRTEIRYDNVLDLKAALKINKGRMSPYIGDCEIGDCGENTKLWIKRLIKDSGKSIYSG